jgi:hypothetical protein
MNYKIKQLGEGRIEFAISKNQFDIDEIVKNNKDEVQYIFLKKEDTNEAFMSEYKDEFGNDFNLSEFESSYNNENVNEKVIILTIK